MAKSSSAKTNILTKQGFKKLQTELEERKTKIRTEIANKLEVATEQGDLSENAAYKAALEEKELNENRIEELDNLLSNSEVKALDDNSVIAGLGDTVILERVIGKKKVTVTLVGQSEANPQLGMVSIESPLGRGIYNQVKGAKIMIKTPNGEVEYKLVSVK